MSTSTFSAIIRAIELSFNKETFSQDDIREFYDLFVRFPQMNVISFPAGMVMRSEDFPEYVNDPTCPTFLLLDEYERGFYLVADRYASPNVGTGELLLASKSGEPIALPDDAGRLFHTITLFGTDTGTTVTNIIAADGAESLNLTRCLLKERVDVKVQVLGMCDTRISGTTVKAERFRSW